jgi:hypothetical protein
MNKSPKDIIAELYQLSMDQTPNSLDIFIRVYGHVKQLHISVIKDCADYSEHSNQNIVLDTYLHKNSETFVDELRSTLSLVLEIVAEHKLKGVA